DWNQSAPVDTTPTLEDIKRTVSNYLAWEVSQLLKRQRQGQGNALKVDSRINATRINATLEGVEWGEFKLGDLFEIRSSKRKFDANKVRILESGGHPYVVRTSMNNGQKGFIDEDPRFLNEGNTISFGQDTATIFYQELPYFTGNRIKVLKLKNGKLTRRTAQFFVSTMLRAFSGFSWGSSSFETSVLRSQLLKLPVSKDKKIDFDFMERFVAEIEKERIAELDAYLKVTGLKD
ncbi:MAG: restriction endonuclease subunit S, partial [Gammaproteobacteria bacterium]|nr:restriction endonuclease subunit S [Gammaproteobacteria bacterium]